MSEADPLVGVWQVSGGTWTISGSPGGYNVIEASPIFGQTGAGIARLAGDQVRIDLQSKLLGAIVYNLALNRAERTRGRPQVDSFSTVLIACWIDHHAEGLNQSLRIVEAKIGSTRSAIP